MSLPMLEQASLKDVRPYALHLKRHFSESFREGTLFHPYSHVPDFTAPTNLQKIKKSWQFEVGEEGWERVWLARHDGHIIGHLDLRAPKFSLIKHRCHLGMGIELAYRRKGIGEALIAQALGWARQRPELVWVDLNVFSHNHGARALYRKMGFQENGEVVDLFRAQNQSINDVSMCLRLHAVNETQIPLV